MSTCCLFAVVEAEYTDRPRGEWMRLRWVRKASGEETRDGQSGNCAVDRMREMSALSSGPRSVSTPWAHVYPALSLLCLSIGEGKIVRVKCSPGLNYHFKVFSHNPDSQGPPACQPYGGAPDFCQVQPMTGCQGNGDLARALRVAGCAGNTPINQMINQAMYIYGNRKYVKCVA